MATNTITGTNSSNILSGTAGVDEIHGLYGDDVITGITGSDTLIGGDGNDTYIAYDSNGLITELFNEGIDTVKSFASSYTLGNEVENLYLAGSGNINGIGNSLNNTIKGNSGSNILNAGTGNDVLIGGDGNDTYIVDSLTDTISDTAGTDTVQISVTYTLGANLENLTLTGTDSINGTGNTLANTIRGNAGNNTLNGGTGVDTMIGGNGNDIYIVNDLGETVDESLSVGIDSVMSSVDFTLGSNIEILTLTGTTAIWGTGNGLNNTITGNALNNILNGYAGTDTLIGGAGNDTYIVDGIDDVLIDTAGVDTAYSYANYSLGANVEHLTLAPDLGNLTGDGNTLNNSITGNNGNNILNGGGGIDTLIGGDGNDTFVVDSITDIITETSTGGTDVVRSSVNYILGASSNVENLALATGTTNINGTGNALANTITGNAGNNILTGGGTGANSDTLIGGLGNDTYNVNATDIVIEAAGEGIDTVISGSNYSLNSTTLSDGVENLTITGTAVTAGGNAANNTIIGNAIDNKLFGYGGNDNLNGGAGNDTLDGGTGVDTMIGGLGNDTYYIDNVGDTITGETGGIDTVISSIIMNLSTYTLAAGIDNVILAGTVSAGVGNTLNNTITGNASNNSLNGKGGNDTLIGGDGDDIYYIDSLTDVITETSTGGTDYIESYISYTIGATSNVEHLRLISAATGTSLIAMGNASDNYITGNEGGNTLSGGGGSDTLYGRDGNDTYVINNAGVLVIEEQDNDEGIDTVLSNVTYSLQADSLSSGVEILTLTGSSAINGTGNAIANTITGNSAINTLIGGDGDDVYILGTGDIVDEVGTDSLVGGIDTVQVGLTYILTNNVENLTLTGTALNGEGNALDNTITGTAGNNILDGKAGADTMIGGLGNDTYVIDDAGDNITGETGGADTVMSSLSYTLGANLDNLTLTGTSQIGLGNALVNIITGGVGDDTLDGAGGIDKLLGAAGDDTYIVDTATDIITEAVGQGFDTVRSSVNYTLGANLEYLTLTGTSQMGVGNTLANMINGTSGNDTLDGGTGADALSGLGGNDIYIIDNAGDVISDETGGNDTVKSTISYTLGPTSNIENLTLTGVSLKGEGNGLNNIITGGAGNDTLSGGAGIDALIGGAGNDTYIIDSITDTLTETATGGIDTVQSSLSYTLEANLENLTLTGTSQVGVGNTLANTITGATGNDTLEGAGGIDKLLGAAGDDTYIVDTATDVITELASGGNDTVRSSVNYTLGINLENLTLTGTSLMGVGNASANIITGTSGNDTLDGKVGADTMYGGNGNDIYTIDNVGDTITDTAGIDTVKSSLSYSIDNNTENLTLTGTAITGKGNASANTIIGTAGVNTLYGLDGADTLDGGAGADSLVGGNGDDTYYVDNAGDKINEDPNTGIDTVRSSVTYSLIANVENLMLSGASAINGTGNSLDNLLVGNSGSNVLTGGNGDDILDGKAGKDTLNGGLGNDTYVIDNIGDTITGETGGIDTVETSLITYSLSANVENLTLTGSANSTAIGNASDNIITGNDGSNTLNGGAGNDTYVFSEFFGNDSITETSGIDTFDFRGLINNIAINLAPIDVASVIYTTDDVIHYAAGTIENIIGGSGNDDLNGGAGDNRMNGYLGNDLLTGGGGNDTYVFDQVFGTDTVSDWGGNDTFDFSGLTGNVTVDIGSFTMSYGANAITWTNDSMDNLIGGSGNDNLTGSGLNTNIDNVLTGGTGNDTLKGQAGNDTYTFSLGDDVDIVNDTAGTDKIVFGSNINTVEIALFLNGTSLVVDYGSGAAGSDQITIQNQGNGSLATSINRLELSNGYYMTAAEINTIITQMASHTGDMQMPTDIQDVKSDTTLMTFISAGWHS